MSNFHRVAFNQDVLSDALASFVWEQKYRYKHPTKGDANIDETRRRVVEAVYAKDEDLAAREQAFDVVKNGWFIPAGRINAGAGTEHAVTLLNCFVSGTIPDSLTGIQRSIAQAALTMQQGGGIGSDYSTIRPAGALVSRTNTVSSGIIPFAQQQDAMCKTIASSGSRRGAMMLTLSDDHPDLWNESDMETMKDHAGNDVLKYPSFISAKRQSGNLTQFNVSVLVSDAFMKAVKEDALWDLGSFSPRMDGKHVEVLSRLFPHDAEHVTQKFQTSPELLYRKGEVRPWYVYRRVRARMLWESIMRSNYVFAEPGVLFIDRINDRNNLNYCETIRCVNPCGEQPLPPHGACNLGSVNLAFLVNNPFTDNAAIDWEAFDRTVEVAVRFLDNVLDVSKYPLEEQAEEAYNKRRIGLGVTGFADMLIQLRVSYGSKESCVIASRLAKRLQEKSYEASAKLAASRGYFPAYDSKFLLSPNVAQLPRSIYELIKKHGIRNGVLNTIAPNGTISLFIGNVSSGIEPNFSFESTLRTVRQPDGSLEKFPSIPYAKRLYESLFGETATDALPVYFKGAMDIKPEHHIDVQAAWQTYIDASISKTVNVATELSYEEFVAVYMHAYDNGCKGCTTYRFDPASGRGAVLQLEDVATVTNAAPVPSTPIASTEIKKRPQILSGRTHKLTWPLTGVNWYITITHDEELQPMELFISTKATEHQEWVTALSRLVTAILRRGGNLDFLPTEMMEVHATTGGVFIDKVFVPSIVAAIGQVLGKEMNWLKAVKGFEPFPDDIEATDTTTLPKSSTMHETCPECGQPTLIRETGCKRCLSCEYEACG